MREIHGAEVSLDLNSTVTDAVTAEASEWQPRPRDPLQAFALG